MSQKLPTVAIDLGTTNSLIAIHDGGKAEVIEMANGHRLLPSVVTFTVQDGVVDVLVGTPAITAGNADPDNCFRHIKRLLGQRWHDGEDTGHQTAEGRDGMTWLKGPDRLYSPAELCALIIITLLDAAEMKLGKRPTRALLAVPAGFRDLERAAVREAARIAGLNEVELIEEPTAAAIAHGVSREKFSRIAVYDLGGGTMDVSYIEAGGGHITVLTTNGDSRLGGKDFDEEIRSDVVRKWFDRYGTDLGERTAAMARILAQAEAAKIELSGVKKSAVRVPQVDATSGGLRNMEEPITQDEFNELIRLHVKRSLDICQRALDDKGLRKSDIHELILVGGSTRIPYVRDQVSAFFGLTPKTGLSPEEAVVRGAAIEAARRDKRGGVDKFTVSHIASHSVGFEAMDGQVHILIAKGEPLPADKTRTVTPGRDDLSQISAHIVQGDALDAQGNASLAHHLIPVEPGPAGVASAQVRVKVDESGLVQAWANETQIYGEADA
jgi:molecular chaperone DnaK